MWAQLSQTILGGYVVILFCFVYSLVRLDFIFSFICISWRIITLQYCSGFCHTLT